MIHIFVDFEMNSIAKELFDEFKYCHMEIIEIGAVAIDDDLKEVGCYKRYIKPQYNEHIMPRYVELTGITDDTVSDAEEFKECFYDFLDWCASFDGMYGYEVFSWSRSDLEQLKRELTQKKIKRNKTIKWMLGHWYDYQKEFSIMIGLSNVMALDRAVSALEQEFSGQMHDALCDAKNAAMLYKMAHDKENFEKYILPLKEAVIQESAARKAEEKAAGSLS